MRERLETGVHTANQSKGTFGNKNFRENNPYQYPCKQ